MDPRKKLKIEGSRDPTNNHEGNRGVPIAPDDLCSGTRMWPHGDTEVSKTEKRQIVTQV